MSPEQYFAAEPTVGSSRRTVRLDLPDLTATFITDRGVFSAEHVDAGTKILLSTVPTPPPGAANLVDLGCGYGPIAITLALRAPDAVIWAVDINRRARDLCIENALVNGCANVRVVSPDDVPADLVVDAIWSNPPIRVGKVALHELLTSWLERLTPEGRTWLVVQKHLGSDSLAVWLDESGWATTRVAARQSFRVLEVGPRGQLRID